MLRHPARDLQCTGRLGRHVGLALALGGAWVAALADDRSFYAEGPDTGAGIGARYMAQAGTGLATSDDVYAAYYNPAGLAQVQGLQISVSRQLNAALHTINFLGLAWKLPLPRSLGLDMTLAGVYYPRIHARAHGAYSEADFESVFLRYLLPGISGTFDGDIDSKTKTYRVALGLGTVDSAWSAGFYVDRIDCKSTFCGVHATSNGYTVSSTGATAVGLGAGLRYRVHADWTLAATVSDIHTRLAVKQTTTDSSGTQNRETQARFPRKLALGVAYRYNADAALAGEIERTQGRYGSSEIDLQILRLGWQRTDGAWSYRAGALAPLKVSSSATGDIKSPSPVSPTLGLGWRSGGLQADFVLYAHPVMSIHKGRASPAADLNLSASF